MPPRTLSIVHTNEPWLHLCSCRRNHCTRPVTARPYSLLKFHGEKVRPSKARNLFVFDSWRIAQKMIKHVPARFWNILNTCCPMFPEVSDYLSTTRQMVSFYGKNLSAFLLKPCTTVPHRQNGFNRLPASGGAFLSLALVEPQNTALCTWVSFKMLQKKGMRSFAGQLRFLDHKNWGTILNELETERYMASNPRFFSRCSSPNDWAAEHKIFSRATQAPTGCLKYQLRQLRSKNRRGAGVPLTTCI